MGDMSGLRDCVAPVDDILGDIIGRMLKISTALSNVCFSHFGKYDLLSTEP